MDAIAEGVETIEQLRTLQQLNCEYIQGYFFSKPVNVASAANLINQPNIFQEKVNIKIA
jgi:EAL domain-containing protein (putative c-di-GMP-specific phosphodiesterase class I)